MPCLGVAVADRGPVLAAPIRVAYPSLSDLLRVLAFDLHRDGEPMQAVTGFDQIAVAPIAARILNVVIQDEDVDQVDEVEISLPRNITGLHDRGALGAGLLRALRQCRVVRHHRLKTRSRKIADRYAP